MKLEATKDSFVSFSSLTLSVWVLEATFIFSETKEVEVIIDNNKNLLSIVEGDTAWTENDKKIIESMKKGKEMIVKGTSSRETLTTDTYTLIGFTAAYNKLKKDC